MSPSSKKPADGSPEAVRRHLSEAARQDLDRLRGELDKKLAALEAALAHPERHDSLESLVIDLARTATAEATSAASTTWLEAQIKADERTAGNGAAASQALEAERTAAAAAARDLAAVRSALEQERKAVAERDRDIEQRRAAIAALELAQTKDRNANTQAVEVLRRELADARQAADEARLAAEAARKALDAARRALETERGARAGVERELANVNGMLEQERMAHEAASGALHREVAHAQRAAEGRAADVESGRSSMATLERRYAELEEAHASSLTRVEALTVERDALATARDSVAGERDRLASERDQIAGERDRFSTERERIATERDQLAAERDRLTGERNQLATERDQLMQAQSALTAERDAAIEAAERARLDASTGLEQTGRERAELEQSLRSAEARANHAMRDFFALTAELDAAKRSADAAQAAVAEKLQKAEAERATLEGALRAADIRNTAHEETAARLDAAEERVRTLEAQLQTRTGDAPAPDIDMASLLDGSGAPAAQPVRRASRYTFPSVIAVRIDGKDDGALIDLSVSGAQVLSPQPLWQNRETTIALVSDEVPVTCKGTIVWTRLDPHSKNRPLRYRAGVLFTDADQGALEAFIIRYGTT